jgi:hypothetical protein
MTTTSILTTNLADSGDQIAIVLVNVGAIQPDGLSTTNSIVTVQGVTYKLAIPFASMITNVQTATIGTTV